MLHPNGSRQVSHLTQMGMGPPVNRWLEGSLRGGVGTDTGMNSDTIMALSGLMGLAAAALTGALWGSPMVTATFRWFAS
jgi:hypothetical protein